MTRYRRPVLSAIAATVMIAVFWSLFVGSRSDAGPNYTLRIDTIAGTGFYDNFPPDNVPATQSALPAPVDVVGDSQKNLYVVDFWLGAVRKISSNGTITTVATAGADKDFGTIAVDSTDNVYVTRTHHHEVDRIDAGGVLTRIAGGGNSGADDIPVLQAYLEPSGLAFDPSGHLWISDDGGRVREVKNGKIHNQVGTGSSTFNGDALPAGSANLNQPQGIAFDTLGNLYIVDKGNNRIRKVTPNLFLTTIAGNGTEGFGGDGGQATNAALDLPFDVTVDSTGVVYIADTFNHRIRTIDNNGKISTLVGTGAAAFGGDGGNPVQASLNTPYGVTAQADGSVVIADSFNSRVRRVTRHYLLGTVPTLGTVPPTLGTIHPAAVPTTQPRTTVPGGFDPEAPVAAR